MDIYEGWQWVCLWRLAHCMVWVSLEAGRMLGVAVNGDWQNAEDGCL